MPTCGLSHLVVKRVFKKWMLDWASGSISTCVAGGCGSRRGARPQGLTREFAGLSAYMSANNPRLINNFHFQPVDGQASPHPTASTALWSSILVRARPGARQPVAELCTGRSALAGTSVHPDGCLCH